MKIVKFKKIKGSKYKVSLDNELDYVWYDEVILKYNLLYNKKLTAEIVDEIIKYNEQFYFYEKVLKFIEKRVRSKFEIEKFLDKNLIDDNSKLILIEKFINNGLINDDMFLMAFVNDKINLSKDGYCLIKKELINNNISVEKIDDYLSKIDEEVWYDKAFKIANKIIKSNNKYGEKYLINSISMKLYNLGYDKETINDVISNLDFTSIDDKIIEKEYNKLYSKYNNKYKKKYELNYFIYSKLMSKGFSDFEIKAIIERR